MELRLEGVGKKVGAQQWLYDLDLDVRPGAVTVLLGATQAGKTSLMRIMAGLDVPTSGRVLVDGVDVVGVPVRERNVAMVYQQFINYPSLKVRDNIASPLKLRGEKALSSGCVSWLKSCTSRCSLTVIRQSCLADNSSAWRWRVHWPKARP